MADLLQRGIIVEEPEPQFYRVHLDAGREVLARLSRFHFGSGVADLERIEALQPGATVSIRISSTDPSAGWVVQTVDTKAEWDTSTNPAALLETIRERADERSLRLFACMCCGEIKNLIPDGPHRRLIDVTKAFAEGRCNASELKAATAAGNEEERVIGDLAHDTEGDPVRGPELAAVAKAIWAVRTAAHVDMPDAGFEIALDTARACAEAVGLHAKSSNAATLDNGAAAFEAAAASQADLVRHLFPNPFSYKAST